MARPDQEDMARRCRGVVSGTRRDRQPDLPHNALLHGIAQRLGIHGVQRGGDVRIGLRSIQFTQRGRNAVAEDIVW